MTRRPVGAFLVAILFFAPHILFHSTGLANEQSIPSLADGQPWTMTNSSGRNGELVMYEDGTGLLRARCRQFRIGWTRTGNQLCIKTPFRGTRCASLQRQSGGYSATSDDAIIFSLSRPL